MLEAGVPPGAVQLANGDPEIVTRTVFEDRTFSALSFIEFSSVQRSLYGKAAEGVVSNEYRDVPRMVGGTSEKNFHLVYPSADIDNAARHTIRAWFEFSGQKCSACSRIFLPQSQATAFLDAMKRELSAVKVEFPEDLEDFLGPVFNQAAFDTITKAIDSANKDNQLERVIEGAYDGSKGPFIDPTIYVSKTPDHPLLEQELIGPVLVALVYPDAEFDNVLEIVDRQGAAFALPGAIFSNDQGATRKAENRLRWAAGNFFANCKTVGIAAALCCSYSAWWQVRRHTGLLK